MSRRLEALLAERTVAAVTLALAVAALWLPVGLGVRGTVEELLIREQYLAGMSVFQVGGHFLRPLAYAPFYAGFVLTPDSFLGLNLLHMLFLWGKGMALFSVLRQLGLRGGLALAAAALFVVLPADDGQMTLRTTAIQGSVALFLLAVALLLRVGQRWSVPLAVATIASLAVSLAIYEVALPLAALAPLLLLRTPGWGRRALAAAVLWYGTLAAVAARYLAVLLTAEGSYQNRVSLAAGGGNWAAEAPLYLGKAAWRTLVGGWVLAWKDLVGGQRADAVLGLAVGLFVTLAVAWLLRQEEPNAAHPPRRLLLALALAGLVVIALGFALYLPTNVRINTWRTLILPSLGGALVLVAVVRGAVDLAGAGWRAFAAGIGLFVALGAGGLATQHRGFAAVSSAQEQVVEGITAAAPVLAPSTGMVLLFDETSRTLSNDVFPFSRYLRAALYPHYRRADLNVHVCYPFVDSRGETCTFGDDGVVVAHQDVSHRRSQLRWQAPYDSVVVLRQDRHGRIELLESLPRWYTLREPPLDYDPAALVDRGEGFASPRGRVQREFGDDGGLGAGWGIPRETAAGVTYRFLPHIRGAVQAPLPVRDHWIEIRIANGLTPELLASLALTVGGEEVLLTRLEPAHFRGRIPARLVAPEGETVLVFEQDPEALAAAQAERGPLVGLGFDRVRLEPVEERESAAPSTSERGETP